MKIYPLILMALLCAWFTAVRAETVANLYQQEVPVADQSASSLKQAARAALEAVVVRVSGERNAAQREGLQVALKQADTWVEQYRYERADSDDELPWRAQIRFSETVVNRMLRQAGLPLWPANRPALLVWTVLDDTSGRHFAASDDKSEWQEGWRRAARQRGLVLRQPLLDLMDRAVVSTDAAWQLRTDVAWQAADRYRADAVLVCRAAQLSGQRWLGSCGFSFQGNQRVLEVSANTPEQFAADVVNRLADGLARQFAIVPVSHDAGVVLLRLDGVNAFTDYAAAMTALESLAGVDSVATVAAIEDRLTLALTINGGVERLQNVLGLDRRLQSIGTVSVDYAGRSTGALHYLWRSER